MSLNDLINREVRQEEKREALGQSDMTFSYSHITWQVPKDLFSPEMTSTEKSLSVF